MKRKLLLCSTLLPSLLAWGASAQVINFNAANNGFVSLPGTGYDALFAGQGVYPDPGNNLWNGFGNDAGYKSTYFYSDQPAATGGGTGPWPQPSGNPGNPYAWYSGITSSGTALFNFTT